MNIKTTAKRNFIFAIFKEEKALERALTILRSQNFRIAGTFGGIAGGLIGLGITEYEALEYEEKIKAGGILISIHIDDDIWEKKAVEILLENGASHIASTLSSKSSEEYSFYDEIKIEHEFDEKRNNPHA